MGEENLWGELLDVLKDISSYLAKEDSSQEEADIDKPPKVSEEEKPIVGGGDPAAKPGQGIAKSEMPDMGNTADSNPEQSIKSKGKTDLKKAKDEDKKEDEDEEDEDEKDDDVDELKSLLKDIKNALLTKSEDNPNISNLISSEIKKQIPVSMEKMLRKMGYSVTKPDVVKIGIDDVNIKKSSDEPGKIESIDGSKEVDTLNKTVDDWSKKSWQELARIREKTGGFNIIP